MSSDVHALPTTGCPVEPLEQLIQLRMICPPGDEPERIPSIYEMLAGAANEPPNVEPGVRPSDTLAGCRLRHVAMGGRCRTVSWFPRPRWSVEDACGRLRRETGAFQLT
jgi:hypothetical protein